jgi:hypothetical protein
MKNKELRARVIAFNKATAERKEKADDLDILITQIMKLPLGQLKKILTDEVIAVLEKYGVKFN